MPTLRLALLDLNAGHANQGIHCLHRLISSWKETWNVAVETHVYEVRINQEIPSLDYDIYISSGGPGSPLESQGSAWENKYFKWIETLHNWNQHPLHFPKKPAFFICHSMQLACRFFDIAEITKRREPSFGIFPATLTHAGLSEKVLNGLHNPFYVVDSRDYQVVSLRTEKLTALNGAVLVIEKERPHVPLERAVLGLRLTPQFFATQFHPEADTESMSIYLHREDKKEAIIKNHGEKKWNEMQRLANNPTTIQQTNHVILPNFLTLAFNALQTEELKV